MNDDALRARNHGKPPEEWTERPCIDCGEPTCNDERCRDCGLERGFARASCRECMQWIIREEFAGPLPEQHRDGCSLANVRDCYPRGEAEVDAMVNRYTESA